MKRLLWLVCVLGLLAGWSSAQTTSSPVTLTIQAGFDGTFRPDEWLPLRITVTNNGAALAGRLLVRPDTNGRALANTFSTPLELSANAAKTSFLYVKVRDFARQLEVEFVGEAGERFGTQTVAVRPATPRDKVYVVLADATAASLALGDVHSSGQNVVQVRWQPEQLPDTATGLAAVDVIYLLNLNPDVLTDAQRDALAQWVYGGGHLVAFGGARWEGAVSAIGPLLPVQPTSVTTLADVSALAAWTNSNTRLTGNTVAAVGTLTSDATALVTQDETVLLARRGAGDGVVDFFALDPTQAPLSSWDGLPAVLLQTLASVPLANSWQRGFLETERAANAIAILPNEQLLPPVTALIAFVLLYVIVIGPLNYLILTRLKRQEWAWITIPLFIVIFSVIAATVGFNLRGSEVILSRLRVVRAWDNADVALEQSIVGLLSPRRAAYTLLPDDDRFISILPSIGQSAASVQSSAEIVESNRFSARNISVDGGIYSNFTMTHTVEPPAIRGSLTLITSADGTQTLQGSVRNDTDQTLQTPVLLTRRGALQLPPLAAGQLLTIDPGQFVFAGEDAQPLASQVENSRALRPVFVQARSAGVTNELQSAGLVLPQSDFSNDTVAARVWLRRQALLQSFVRDQYNSVALGNRVYLFGWTDEIPADVTLAEATWRSVDDTLYIVEMAVTVQPPPAGQMITLAPDQFVWTITERITSEDTALARQAGLIDVDSAGIDDIVLNPQEGVAVQFTPLPSAVLTTVDRFEVTFVRGGGFANQMELSLWNWETRTWDVQDLQVQRYLVEQPQPYLGANNAVRLRMVSTYPNGVSRLRTMRLTMTGS